MNTALAAGCVLTVVGLAGYAVGVAVAYPGRAFSVTSVMVGVTLLAVGRGSAWTDPDEATPEDGSLDSGRDST
jgi:hypothetical protein